MTGQPGREGGAPVGLGAARLVSEALEHLRSQARQPGLQVGHGGLEPLALPGQAVAQGALLGELGPGPALGGIQAGDRLAGPLERGHVRLQGAGQRGPAVRDPGRGHGAGLPVQVHLGGAQLALEAGVLPPERRQLGEQPLLAGGGLVDPLGEPLQVGMAALDLGAEHAPGAHGVGRGQRRPRGQGDEQGKSYEGPAGRASSHGAPPAADGGQQH